MLPQLIKTSDLQDNVSRAILADDFQNFNVPFLNGEEYSYFKEKIKDENEWVLYKHPLINFFCKTDRNFNPSYYKTENARKAGSKLFDLLKKENIDTVQVVNNSNKEITMAFLEGLLLSCYAFLKYKKQKDGFIPHKIYITDSSVTEKELSELVNLVHAVFFARNLVNEPLSYLTADCLSKEIEKLGNEAGFSVEIYNKKKIEALRMGGLLAVNKGSIEPPTFTILEWKPEHSKNSTPLVLVGKGVVYDTGGLSLKPTPKSMDYMKSDMAGGAVVAATIFAAAKNKLPVHIIGLVPATDNRPDGNAYVPGDVITMFDGTTVEIKNTDAEGRLLLADALSYAKKYKPLLVLDVATLTGSAEVITGSQAMVAMGNTGQHLQLLKSAGESTFERLVEVPLWEEYAKPLESSIADLNNLGVREAQTSIAGKFLEHFIDYPWIHLDIAGVAYLHEKDSYRPAGGTGFGVRLLYHFLKIIN